MRPSLSAVPRLEGIEERLRRVIAIHFDPQQGSRFWLERAATLGIDPRREVRSVADLALLGEMAASDLASRPLLDFIPRRCHTRMDRFVVGQTGGTTGRGQWTAYRDDEFQEAFVLPFVAAAAHLRFPAGEQWLFIGPSGPHIIGKVVRHLANALGSCDPFSVDFDPRWARKMPEDSFGRQRYLRHVLEQALQVIRTQPIGVLFTTPVVLRHLARAMTPDQRQRIRGVHYGGMAVPRTELRMFEEELFTEAVHLSGYGNTLFGCCLEVDLAPEHRLEYFPFGDRLLLDVVDDDGLPVSRGETGWVRLTRLDESFLIVRFRERDVAAPASAPATGPDGFFMRGVVNPRPPDLAPAATVTGLY